jgi:hypothetical protein
MVYSPLTRRPAADHGHGPVRLGRFRPLFRNPEHLPWEICGRVLKLVAF